jgi:DNA-binding SARP family transcriptional activator
MRFGVLGPLAAWHDDGTPVDLGGRQPRLVLATLLVADGRPVSADALIDVIWGDEPPASATSTLHSYISRLRRRLGADGRQGPLTLDQAGYRLDIDPDAVDLHRFERLSAQGRGLLDDQPAEAHRLLTLALSLWRGPALGTEGEHDRFAGFVVRLEELRLGAVEHRLDAELALGRHADAVAELRDALTLHPYREGLWARLALALYRSGRQADALRALADASVTLRDGSGLEVGRELRELEAAILAQDDALDHRPHDPGRTTSPARSPRGRAPAGALVGRGDELAELRAARAESAADARFVVVEGEAGIGKTRLADELRPEAEADGALVVWGRADESGAAPALWPWLPVLRALAAERALPPDLSELLAGQVTAGAGQGPTVQFARFEAVAAALEEVGRLRGVVVLVDDLQWADPTSLELLSFLTRRLEAGVLVVTTLRVLEIGRRDAVTEALAVLARRPGSRRLLLSGLTEEATSELVGLVAPGAPDGARVRISRRAEGNPFYARELARLLLEEGGRDLDVPATVGDVVRRRLARLAPVVGELLAVAAVVGREVEPALLARATGRPLTQVAEQLEPAIVHRLLVDVGSPAGTLRFEHTLVRDVLLEDLTSLRRARLHLDVADAMEAGGAGPDQAELLAEHLWRAAALGVGRRAAEALERAAEVSVHRVASHRPKTSCDGRRSCAGPPAPATRTSSTSCGPWSACWRWCRSAATSRAPTTKPSPGPVTWRAGPARATWNGCCDGTSSPRWPPPGGWRTPRPAERPTSAPPRVTTAPRCGRAPRWSGG